MADPWARSALSPALRWHGDTTVESQEKRAEFCEIRGMCRKEQRMGQEVELPQRQEQMQVV